MNINEKYPVYIVETVRQNMGLEPEDNSQDDEILKMSKKEILNRVCDWEGLIGYGDTIKAWIENIWGISLDKIERQQNANKSDGAMSTSQIKTMLNREVFNQMQDNTIKLILKAILFNDNNVIDWTEAKKIIMTWMPELRQYPGYQD